MPTYPPYGLEHGVVAMLRGGQVIAYGQASVILASATANAVINVRIPDLKQINYVLDVQCHTDPDTTAYAVRDMKISGNVVGMTLTTGAGTTLTVGALAIGPGM